MESIQRCIPMKQCRPNSESSEELSTEIFPEHTSESPDQETTDNETTEMIDTTTIRVHDKF